MMIEALLNIFFSTYFQNEKSGAVRSSDSRSNKFSRNNYFNALMVKVEGQLNYRENY